MQFEAAAERDMRLAQEREKRCLGRCLWHLDSQVLNHTLTTVVSLLTCRNSYTLTREHHHLLLPLLLLIACLLMIVTLCYLEKDFKLEQLRVWKGT